MGNLTLFPLEEVTDERLRAKMEGNTCRTCIHRIISYQGSDGEVKASICESYKSKISRSGHLRVKVNQPACILYVQK